MNDPARGETFQEIWVSSGFFLEILQNSLIAFQQVLEISFIPDFEDLFEKSDMKMKTWDTIP